MLSSIRRVAKQSVSKGVVDAVHALRREWRIMQIHRRNVARAHQHAMPRPLKLNLGSGGNLKPGWINVDLFTRQADLQLDLRERWPFPDESVQHIYSEHLFEHFAFHTEVPHVLAEGRRVLVPGGTFDVGVPNTDMALRGYGDPEDEYWRLAKTIWHPKWCETQLDHINYHFRQDGEHQWAWDAPSLKAALERAGFVEVTAREFDPALDTEGRRVGTLYMRAYAPDRSVAGGGRRSA